MLTSRNLLSGKRKYGFALIFLSFISVICAAFSITGSDDYATAKTEVVLRRVGDELLLQSGDSTSRVLPVTKIADNEYQISFEKEFAFLPDSLINISKRLLGKNYPQDYIVTVLNCSDSSVAYGYAISKNEKEDIIACKGRKQPVACYRINIKWEPTGLHTAQNAYLLGSLPFLAFVGFVFLKSVRLRKALPDSKPTTTVTLGSLLFDAKDKKLIKNGETIDLTGTETRILLILALSPNETIERSRLQKEIWEDDGVIVGRSLDMFISKLRKKLELDPNISIVVIRSKGYKLEVNS